MSKHKKNGRGAEAAGAMDDEAERILLCARLVAIGHEHRTISAADNWAPDKGPLHGRYEGLLDEQRGLMKRLRKLGIPTSHGGAVAFSRLAVLEAERTHTGDIVAQHIDDWVVLAAVQAVARSNVPMVLAQEIVVSEGDARAGV